ncbi:choice-of-anchor D domain-containing protein, partial [Candidatus Binatus sp.]|uniref:choice-of-anchor D domain-containing protein n=1 Tax=Candidatus Binatus sp. TaxID=2811406 RepID=UPI003CA3D42A
ATVVDPTATAAFFCATGALGDCDDGPSAYSVVTVPIKVHLNNVTLGSNCYIGSDADPIVLNLQETTTSAPVLGSAGNALLVTGVEVADNTFAVPVAYGCGPLGTLDAAIDLKVGLPSPSGKNSALIEENGETEVASFLVPTPTATPSDTPTATPTDDPSATSTPTETAIGTAVATATATLTATAAATETATPTPTATAKVTIKPASLTFAKQEVGTTSTAKDVTLTNPNSFSLQINSVMASAGDFSLSSDGCSGTDLGPGANCVVGVEFTPSATGTRTGSLTISDAAANSPQSVSLSGTGILAKPTYSPTHVSFGQQPVEVPSSAETITLTNPNSISLSVTSVVPSGDFTTVNDTCSGTQVTANGTCTFGVIFTPSQTGTRTGNVVVSDNAVTPTQTINLSGVGIIVTPTVSPTSLSYGRVEVDTISAAQTVMLSNSNAVAVTFTSITASAPYVISANGCGASVPANSSCQVSVTFDPTSASKPNGTTENGKLTFVDNGHKSTQVVDLTGIAFGTAPSPTASATPTATSTSAATATPTSTATSTLSATATPTSTATSTATLTATATATRTATATATPTVTATATTTTTATATTTLTATATATATSTTTSTPSATPTSTPGPEAGGILIAGGDIGGKLEGLLELATSTVSSAAAQVFNTSTNTFTAVGSLNTPRESAAAVVLPNGKVLIVGGENCQAAAYDGATSGAFLCTALQTAELYDENTQTFSFAGSGSDGLMTIARSGPSATLIEGSGTALDGQVLIVGGSTGISFLSATAQPGEPSETALNTGELYNPATDAFTALPTAIPGCPAGESSTTTPACSDALPSTCASPTIETPITAISESGTTVTVTTAANPPGLTVGSSVVIAGVVNPTTGVSIAGYNNVFSVATIPTSSTFTFTAASSGLAAASSGFTSAGNILSASESGTLVTVNTTANPPGLLVGSNVTVSAVKIGTSFTSNGYDGEFAVTAIPSSTSFQYTAATSGLGAASGGGAATADTFECGILDQGAAVIPGASGDVLLAGGDFIEFLGESSNYSFIFNPSMETFSKTMGNLVTPRELASLVAIPSEGTVVSFGGVEANSAACPANSGEIVVSTLTTAEVYNPGSQSWGTTANNMSVKRAATATPIVTGALAGDVILPGGVDVEAGTLPSTCVALTSLEQSAQSQTDLYEPGTGAGGTFVGSTGSLIQPREGTSQGFIGAGADETLMLAGGGACTQKTPTLESAPIGTATAASVCGATSAETDFSELYNQSTQTWTPGPQSAGGITTAAIASASESGNTVTITMSTANPVGLAVNGNVTIAGVSVSGYDGTFPVTAIPSSTTFQYIAPTSGLGAGTGGNALAVTTANAAATAVLP